MVLALAFGGLFAATAWIAGPRLYAALGAEAASLADAQTFSAWVFGGAPFVWLVSLMTAAMRGAGEVRLPALVSVVGAAVLVPLSPLLMFGAGPLPGFGLAGAGLATLLYYAAAFCIYLRYLLSGSGVLTLRRTFLHWQGFSAIMRVGGISAIGTILASLTAVGLTGVVGREGPEALAGYGIASRIDSLLVPMLFGLGSGVVTMVAAASGAGQHDRAARVAVLAAMIAFGATSLLGVILALFPDVWMRQFTSQIQPLSWGQAYLQTNGPFYGFAGAGLIFYFAAQGRGQMRAAFIAALLRLLITAGGAFAMVVAGFSLQSAFVMVAVGSIIFAVVNAMGLLRSLR